MSRTTLNIDDAILADLRRLQETEQKSLGQLVSELLARALADRAPETTAPDLQWTAQAMRPLVDIDDYQQVAEIVDSESYDR